MNVAVRLRGAICCLGNHPALVGVDLCVDYGKVVLLRGPNGAGKTTLLRLCAGLAPLSAGEGEVLGCNLSSERRKVRSQVGMAAHHTMLYEDLTVAENLRFWAKLWGSPQEQTTAALRALEVDASLWDSRFRQLSAGQRKRISLALVAVRRPRLWLLDEPHASLDEHGQAAVNSLIEQASASGATVMLASHEDSLARSLADHTVFLAGGSVLTQETGGVKTTGGSVLKQETR